MAQTQPALEARGLAKLYPGGRGNPRVAALDGLSFSAETGTIFGLPGRNGAGKSTTVKILATLARSESGRAFVAGIDVGRRPSEVRRTIGFVAQKQVSDPMDTGRETWSWRDGCKACPDRLRRPARWSCWRGFLSPMPQTARSRATRAEWPGNWMLRSA